MNSLVVGHYPTSAAIHRLISQLKENVRRVSRGAASIAERHNAYTDYCMALLFCATGHRPVISPFEHLWQFDTEERLALICDKVVAQSRAWRLVALPEIAADQVKAYQNYLPKLAGWLEENPRNKELPRFIRGLLRSGEAEMPLFFYIEEETQAEWRPVTPSEMRERWQSMWPLPVNFLRHMMAENLWRASYRGDWVSIQLGHIDGVCHPLGETITESPRQILSAIGNVLNGMLTQMGWEVAQPPLRERSGAKSQGPEGDAATRENRISSIERREIERENRHKRLADEIYNLVRFELEYTDFTSMSVPDFTALVESLVEKLLENELIGNAPLRELYRLVGSQPGGRRLLLSVSQWRKVESERSPFSATTLEDYRQLQGLRRSFVTYLNKQEKSLGTLSAATRAAEIVISAAIFDGFAMKSWLEKLLYLLPECVQRIDETVFVDIPLGNVENDVSAVYRWYPCDVSKALIIGGFAKFSRRDTHQPKLVNIGKELKSILKAEGINTDDAWTLLARLARSGTTLELPGYLSSVLSGKTCAVSIPRSQYIRVVSGKSLIQEGDTRSSTDIELINNTHAVWTVQSRKDQKPQSQLRFLAFLKRAFADAELEKGRESGNKSASNKQKQKLRKIVKDSLEGGASYSSNMLLLLRWTDSLCASGTRYTKNIKFSTIRRYVIPVAKPLLSRAKDIDLLAADSLQLEEIYTKALDYVDEDQRRFLVGRIEEFHAFLEKNGEVESVDWSSIYGGVPRDERFPDANVISQAEYLRCLLLIDTDNALSPLRRNQYAALLVLGYRFALRFGEAFKLQYRDVRASSDFSQVEIDVRNSIYGDVKTSSGVRVCTLGEPLTDREIRVLKKLLSSVTYGIEENIDLPLMLERQGRRNLLDRFETVNYLHRVMRLVTGDKSVRFHHFRHGWATRMVAKIPLANISSSNTDAVVDQQTSMAAVSAQNFVGNGSVYSLRSISTYLGHSTTSTTLGSYTHSIDEIAAGYAEKNSPRLTGAALSYCLLVGHQNLRQQKGRLGGAAELLQYYAEKVVSLVEVPLVDYPDSLQSGVEEGVDAVTFDIIELYLRRLKESDFEPRFLAERMYISASQAGRILDAAKLVERESGFRLYEVERHTADDISVASGAKDRSEKPFSKRSNTLIQSKLSIYENTVSSVCRQDKSDIFSALDVWVRGYHPATGVVIVTTLNELDALLNAAKHLGIGVVKKIVWLDQRLAKKDDVVQSLRQRGLEVGIRKISNSNEKLRSRRDGRIELKLDYTSGASTPGLANRDLFILAVVKSMMSIPE